MIVGVLAIQGGVIEHLKHIKALGHIGVEVRDRNQLEKIDRLIIPGGESTTINKILKYEDILVPLREKIKNGLKVWGTCAGMILLAKQRHNEVTEELDLMNIKVKRNFFGRQLGSYCEKRRLEALGIDSIELVFIRAPIITEVGENVEVLLKSKGQVVAAKENNILVTSFHPELTEDLRFHKYFIEKF